MTVERALTGLTKAGASAATYVEDVFSTYLYTGTDASQTITNGIDLATKGGMVWLKCRQSGNAGNMWDTVRGATKYIQTNALSGQSTLAQGVKSFSTSGFVLGDDSSVNATLANGGGTYASWTFRKQPKFFDIVTYTGTGSATTIAHNLGATPGMIIVKRTDTTSNWQVYHKGLTSAAYAIQLNLTAAQASATTVWNSTAPTSSVFSVGTDATVNASGGTYVAYIYADQAGGFGAAGTDSVVACGSYAGTGSAGLDVSLGWEPQLVMIKAASAVGNWWMLDTMRGFVAPGGSGSNYLIANTADAEVAGINVNVNSAGFTINTTGTSINSSGGTFIYLAIRRGPMKTPTDATKVFSSLARTGTGSSATVTGVGFSPDFIMSQSRSLLDYNAIVDRLRGAGYIIRPAAATQENNNTANGISSITMDGFNAGSDGTYGSVNYSGIAYINWFLKRAPGFFDVVCYTGTGAQQSVAHNLGVAPELIIVKARSSDAYGQWNVWLPSSVGTSTAAALYSTAVWSVNGNLTSVSSTSYTTGTNTGGNNTSGGTFVAYLFASCPGVSKVFSFTGNGSSQTIDCGFTNGARFVLIKRTDSTGDWWVYDSARGIVSANDPALRLNSTAAEVTSADAVDPASSGFIVNQEATCNINVNSATYIGLAIA